MLSDAVAKVLLNDVRYAVFGDILGYFCSVGGTEATGGFITHGCLTVATSYLNCGALHTMIIEYCDIFYVVEKINFSPTNRRLRTNVARTLHNLAIGQDAAEGLRRLAVFSYRRLAGRY
jgi:hypothetical protein